MIKKKLFDFWRGTNQKDVHQRAVKVVNCQKKNQFVNLVLKQNNESLDKTSKIFRTCYFLAKNNRPYMDHSDLIDFQSLNGLGLGTFLH